MWQWFFGQVEQENFVISDVAIKEVKQKILYRELEIDIPESAVFIKILNTIIVKTIQNHAPIYAVCGFSNYPNKY
jgi:hypothetical protein